MTITKLKWGKKKEVELPARNNLDKKKLENMAILATNKQETNKKEKHRCPFKEKKNKNS